MYLTVENINNLNNIISELNNIEDENKKKQFLSEHIEDTELFLEAIRKINKQKIPKKNGKARVLRIDEESVGQYQEEEIYNILRKKSNAEMMKEYPLSELKNVCICL